MSRHSLKTQAIYLFSGRVLAFLVVSMSSVILVRMMNSHQFGTYRQVLFILQLAVPLITMRIPDSLYYFFPRERAKLSLLISQTMILLVIAASVGTIFFIALGFFFEVLPSGISREYVFPIALYLLIETVAQLIEHMFILDKEPGLVLAQNAGSSVVRFLLVLGAVILFDTILAVVYALIVLSLLRLLIIAGYLVKKHAIRLGLFDRLLLGDQIKYTAPLAASGIIGIIGSKIDKGIISGCMTPEHFAVYSIGGLGIISSVRMLYHSVGKVCLPRFGELKNQNNLEEVRVLWHKMIVMNALTTVPVVFFCCTVAVPIITLLYTEKYVAAVNVWRINMIILFVQMLGFGLVPSAFGKTRTILMGNVVRFVVAVSLSVVLIAKLGIVGGAISFVLGFWANALVQLAAVKRALGVSIWKFLPWARMGQIVIIGAVPAVFLFYLSSLGFCNVVTILIGAAVYFPVVALLFLLTGVIRVKEFKGFSGKAR